VTTPDPYPLELAGEPADPPVEAPADLVEAWRDFEDAERDAADEAGPLYGAAAWRPAPAIAQLVAEADAANPARDRRSDGIVGDLRHQARVSGHNPDGRGVVVAADLDKDGLPMPAAVERARQLAAAGNLPQLAYVIHAGRITARDFAGWLEYDGENPHVTHAHFETFHDGRGDSVQPWGIFVPARAATPRPAPTTPRNAPRAATRDLRGRGLDLRGEQGNAGPRVAALQAFLARVKLGGYARLEADGQWGPRTSGVLAHYGHRVGVHGADGRTIGPQLARRLWSAGFRG
jgi:hypothetical protein